MCFSVVIIFVFVTLIFLEIYKIFVKVWSPIHLLFICEFPRLFMVFHGLIANFYEMRDPVSLKYPCTGLRGRNCNAGLFVLWPFAADKGVATAAASRFFSPFNAMRARLYATLLFACRAGHSLKNAHTFCVAA